MPPDRAFRGEIQVSRAEITATTALANLLDQLQIAGEEVECRLFEQRKSAQFQNRMTDARTCSCFALRCQGKHIYMTG